MLYRIEFPPGCSAEMLRRPLNDGDAMTLLQFGIDVCVRLISGFGNREIAFEVAFATIGVAIGLGLWTWLVHRKFVGTLVRTSKTLTTIADDSKSTPADQINRAAKVLAQGPFKLLWTPYRRSVRPDLENDGKYVNLVDPYDWFALERLPGRGYEKWATTLAGVFLTVGLLFTFIGLSAALFTVGDAGTDAIRLRDAINEILKISSAKFITSIAGIMAYIGWTLLARICASGQSKAANALARSVQRLTTYATPETLLYTQTRESQVQADRLKTFADDVATAFDQKMGARFDALHPTLQDTIRPVVDAIQGMGASIGEGNQSAIADMVSGMMTEVRGAAGAEMQSLVEAMRETTGELRAAKTGIGDTGFQFSNQLVQAAENMSTAAARVAATMEGRAADIDTRMQRIDEALSSGAQSLSGIGANMSEALEQGLRRALDAMAEASSASARNARSHVEAELAPLIATLQESLVHIRQSAAESRGELTEGGRAARAELEAAIGRVGSDLARTSAETSSQVTDAFRQGSSEVLAAIATSVAGLSSVTEGLAMQLGQVGSNIAKTSAETSTQVTNAFRQGTSEVLAAMVTSVRDLSSVTEGLAQRLGQAERSFATLDQSVRQQVGHLDATGNTILTAGRNFGTASEELRRAAAPVTAALGAVEGSANAARDTLQNVIAASDAMKEAASAIGAASATADSAFRSYQERFGTVDEALGRTVARMRDGVIELGNRVGEVVREYDQHLADAVGKLGNGVGDLSEAVDELTETCGLIRRSRRAVVGVE